MPGNSAKKLDTLGIAVESHYKPVCVSVILPCEAESSNKTLGQHKLSKHSRSPDSGAMFTFRRRSQ